MKKLLSLAALLALAALPAFDASAQRAPQMATLTGLSALGVGTNATGGTNWTASGALFIPNPQIVQLLVSCTVSNAQAIGQIAFVVGRSLDNTNWTFHDLVVSNPVPTVFGPLSTNFINGAPVDMTLYRYIRINGIENTNTAPWAGVTNIASYVGYQ